MSMPQPIFVALVGSTTEQVLKASKFFRLSQPGIGAALLAATNALPGGKVIPLDKLPLARIHLWICLDQAALEECESIHQSDRLNPDYYRGFYQELFPAACVLVQHSDPKQQKELLSSWAQKVIQAWVSTS
jgi:hypothetical protein